MSDYIEHIRCKKDITCDILPCKQYHKACIDTTTSMLNVHMLGSLCNIVNGYTFGTEIPRVSKSSQQC